MVVFMAAAVRAASAGGAAAARSTIHIATVGVICASGEKTVKVSS
jgi:hypothetical protein